MPFYRTPRLLTLQFVRMDGGKCRADTVVQLIYCNDLEDPNAEVNAVSKASQRRNMRLFL